MLKLMKVQLAFPRLGWIPISDVTELGICVLCIMLSMGSGRRPKGRERGKTSAQSAG